MKRVTPWVGILLVGALTHFASAQADSKCPAPNLSASAIKRNKEAPSGTADLGAVITTVEAALKCYQDNRGQGPDALPALAQAEFDFKTTTQKSAGLTISFLIFKIGGSKEKDTTNELTFTYSLPKSNPISGPTFLPPKPQLLSDAIVADIQSAAAAVKDQAKVDKLIFSKLKMVLQFGVVADATGSASGLISLVTLAGNGEYKRNDTQSVTLTFGQ